MKEYKNLLDQGLINEQDYSKLKNSILFPNNISNVELKSINKNSLDSLKRIYRSDFITGSVLIPSGFGVIGGGIYYKNNKAPSPATYVDKNGNLNTKSYNAALHNHKVIYIAMICSGSAIIGVGFALEILGIHHRSIYLDSSKNVSLGFANDGLGFAICFN
ncbi:MAG: hypothetical protein U0T77_04365 [Chitinophagales bacterium]